MSSNEKKKSGRGRKAATAGVLGLLVLLALFLRNCFGLGGKGEGEGEPVVDARPAVTSAGGDARTAPGGDGGAAIVEGCRLQLDSTGLREGGDAVTTEQAVDRCRRAGRAHLRVTGGARTGDYRGLVEALEEAGVPIDERQWPENP